MRILIARSGGPAGTDRLLAVHRHRVDVVYSASDASRAMDQHPPDLVITGLLFDNQFPSPRGEDGLAVLRAATARRIPCMCMTSWASPVLQACATAGFSHVFLMPGDVEAFLVAVDRVRQDLMIRAPSAARPALTSVPLHSGTSGPGP